jgi:hypothetical protein
MMAMGGKKKKGKSSEMEGEAKRASKKSFFSRLLLPSTREEKRRKKKANEAKWLALGSFNSLDGLKLFFSSFHHGWLLLAGSLVAASFECGRVRGFFSQFFMVSANMFCS